MKKGLAFIFACMALVLVIAGSACAAPAPVKQVPLADAIKAELINVAPSFFGAESITLIPQFKVSNSGNQGVWVSMSYNLFCNGDLVSGSVMPKVYVPAKSNLTVRDSIALGYTPYMTKFWLSCSNDLPTALKMVAPLWKSMGGKQPTNIDNDLWKATPTDKAVYKTDLTLQLSDGTKSDVVNQSLQWSE